jgi:hypothetical protein
MIDKKTWEDFKKAGMLWFVNSILHVFGWSIVVELKANGEIAGVYPARVKFRGFSEDSNTQGYKNITNYLKENVNDLHEEINKE